MTSIQRIKASDGSGNANLATVQSTRSPGATTIVVDTVLGMNSGGFMASMGTPHTFTDPITSETITVISEATAVDFIGHITSGHIEIDTIAPGYTDLGSAIGDIVIIRPTTQYADNIAAVLGASHKDDGTHMAVVNYDPARLTLETQKWAGVASAVNEVTVTNAVTGSPPKVQATGDDTDIDLEIGGKGAGLLRLDGIRHQNITTNSTKSGVIMESGWRFVSSGAGGASLLTLAMTFPTAFTTLLSLNVSVLGMLSGSDPAVIADLATATNGDVFGSASAPTNSGFTANLKLLSGTFASGQRWAISWVAIGIK